MSFRIETFRSTKTPWEIFQSVYADASSCFFLDSANYTSPDRGYSYIGMGPSLEIRLDDKSLYLEGEQNGKYPAGDLFPVLNKILKENRTRLRNAPPFFGGGLVGYFGYEAADLCDDIKFRAKPASGLPRLYFGLFRDVLVFDHRKQVFYLLSQSGGKGRHSRGRGQGTRGLEKVKSYFGKQDLNERRFELKRFTAEMSRAHFKKIVRRAKDYIAAGDIYQANLSQRFSFEYEGSSLELYGRLRAINPSPFSCFLKAGDLEIVSSSPERLIRKNGRLCETRPIAGTCPGKGSSKRMEAWRKKLFGSAKERAEHLMLVDLERNDLGRVCDYRSVKVEKFMTLEKYSHVMHLVSKVTGTLQKDKDALDLVRAMFPGGTITGCPKIRCMEIIDELEPVRRGIYTGSLGYIDLRGDMDLNIVIRTIVLKKGRGHLQVGAGIVHDSDPEKEYEETLHKAEALIQALRTAGKNEL